MSGHTPGPWAWYNSQWNGMQLSQICDDNTLKFVIEPSFKIFVSEADSRLIAAAPDLLEALITLVKGVDSLYFPNSWECMQKAKAAIAKATGEEVQS